MLLLEFKKLSGMEGEMSFVVILKWYYRICCQFLFIDYPGYLCPLNNTQPSLYWNQLLFLLALEQYWKQFGSVMSPKNTHNHWHNTYTSKHLYEGLNLKCRKKESLCQNIYPRAIYISKSIGNNIYGQQ